MVIITVNGASISVETGPSASVADLWTVLTQGGYTLEYYRLTCDGQEIDDGRLIGDLQVLELDVRPEIKPLWYDFWATKDKDLNVFPAGHPARIAFEANLWSQRLEFLAIMKHTATGDFSSATIASDYYKLAMASVIRQALNEKGDIVVTFALNLRTPGLEEKLAANEGGILDDFIRALSRFQERIFNRDIISKVVAGRTIEGFWCDNLDEICGSERSPRSLIRGERIGPDSDYWPGTCIYKRQTDPADVRDGEVVLSVFYTEDNKLHIEATGPWNKSTFLETPIMQAVYQVLLDHHLRKKGVSFGQWLYEALFREHLSCAFATETCPKMKGALFAGRRTGHHIFTLFQTWYASRYYPNCIGTSSFDAWHTLSNVLGMPNIVPPVGTHAHELSMVFMCLYPELDQNSEGIQFSQVLAHYMFYLLVHQGTGTTPMPMLPDTLGTTTFLKAAKNTLVTPMLDGVPQTQHQVSILSLFKSARQDSGTIRGFKQMLSLYPEYSGSIMASEISKREDLETARDEGYTTFGTGGFMGDSETAWPVTTDPFTANMAVKAVSVYVRGVRTAVQPVKLGDGEGKATCDTTLPKEEQETILRNANYVKQAAIDAPHGNTIMRINEKFERTLEAKSE
jgi:nicotinic acid phosphoribosyltransferase